MFLIHQRGNVSMVEELLRMQSIEKSFPGVKALKNVTLTINKGEVLALIGENGAGKSTLMKILSGVYQKDAGSIFVEGKPVEINSPQQSIKLGISIIYQELNQMPNLSIAENIFVGREKRKNGFMIDIAATQREAQSLIAQVGLDLDVTTLVKDLSIAQRQMVEVAKALSVHARIIVMDEPTSSLTDRENVILMDIIRKLRDQGVSIVFITHKLVELFGISDRVTVLRDGESVGTVMTKECTEDVLIQMMVGRDLANIFPKTNVSIGENVLEVKNLYVGDFLQDISFTLKKGEILGFAGLVGAGRSELMRAIFGVDKMDRGEIMVDGKLLGPHHPDEAIALGVGFVPEDRKLQGLILGMSVRENTTLPNLAAVSKNGVINEKIEKKVSEEFIKKLDVKTTGIEQKVENLSGGNQQKVVIAKWLASNPKILILDEPTRGIDVGAKKEIHALMGELTAQGVAIIMVSSELPEVLGMSDRIIVMHNGRIQGELAREEASQEKIMTLILSGETSQPKRLDMG